MDQRRMLEQAAHRTPNTRRCYLVPEIIDMVSAAMIWPTGERRRLKKAQRESALLAGGILLNQILEKMSDTERKSFYDEIFAGAEKKLNPRKRGEWGVLLFKSAKEILRDKGYVAGDESRIASVAAALVQQLFEGAQSTKNEDQAVN